MVGFLTYALTNIQAAPTAFQFTDTRNGLLVCFDHQGLAASSSLQGYPWSRILQVVSRNSE